MAPERSGFTLQPWSQFASRVTGGRRVHGTAYTLSTNFFKLSLFFPHHCWDLIYRRRKTDKIIFLIPLFDCFITWVTQSKGSRGPMHSRHYAGNLFFPCLAPIPIMHVWCLAFLSYCFFGTFGVTVAFLVFIQSCHRIFFFIFTTIY